MAQKFGLEWQAGELNRMRKFVDIMFWEIERDNKAAGKSAPRGDQKFRPRM